MGSNVKMNLGEVCCEGEEWIQLTNCTDQSLDFVNTVMKFKLHANSEFLPWLNIDQLQKAGMLQSWYCVAAL
jgi:hypothetical protein